MNGFVFSYFNGKHKIIIFSLFTSLVLFGSVYYVLDAYFNTASLEVVESWRASEFVNIQQGNILSAVTKLQRPIHKSVLLKGVRVVDGSRNELIRFGKVVDFETEDHAGDAIAVKDLAPFSKVYSFKSEGVEIFIFTQSLGLFILVGVIGIYLISITFAFAYFIHRNVLKEEKLKAELSMQKIRLENSFNTKIAEIARRTAHDVRSPLSFLNAISHKIRGTMPDEGKILGDVSARIIDIAEGLLEISRKLPLDSDDIEREPKINSDVKRTTVRLVQKACELVLIEKEVEIANLGINIRFKNTVTDDFKISADSKEISRIVSNLVSNSIEAIEVKEGLIDFIISEEDAGLSLTVQDNGIGMSADLIARVFRGPVSEGKKKGNGLGLWPAIAQVHAWGGNLKINSSPHGTSIKIFLKKL